MEQKIISLQEKITATQAEKQEQIELLKKIKTLIEKQEKYLEDDEINEKITINNFYKIITSWMDGKNITLNQIKIYLKFVNDILEEKNKDDLEKALDIATYTCMVSTSQQKILKIDKKTVQTLMISLVEANVSVTSYEKYLDILLHPKMLSLISNNQELIETKHIISDIIYIIEPFTLDRAIKKIEKEISFHSNNSFNKFSNQIFDEYNLEQIYFKLKEQMININESLNLLRYTKKEFQTLEKIKKINYLERGIRQSFLDTVVQIDKNTSGIIEKIDRILILINNFCFQFKKQNSIIEINFTERKK